MRFNKITYGILSACGLAMTLTACQNEADLETTASGNYISVPVSTVITVPDDAETRTTLNELAGDLQWEWEEGDQVLVIDRMTGARGYLTAGEPTQDGKTAPFSGSVNFEAGATSAKLSIFYVGKGVNPTSIESEIKIDLENQDGKSESLVKRDVLSTGLTESTAVDVVINPTHTVINDFELKHMTSAGHFQLKIKDGEPINNTAVTITKASEGTLISPFSCKIIQQSTGEVSLSEDGTEDGSITTTTDATGEFYITMMPNSKMSMKFVTTYNGKTYTGYLGGREDFYFELSAGQYLRSNSNSNNYGPLVIEMEADEPTLPTVDESEYDRIFGLKWTNNNNRSWIDAATYDNDITIFTYIPGVPLSEQDIDTYYTTIDLTNTNNNAVAYFYQWDRDFGFILGSQSYAQVTPNLPNYNNLPSWAKNIGYDYTTNQLTITGQYDYFEKFGCGSRYNDWCSTTGRYTWGRRTDYDVYAQPNGFRIPTKAEYSQLVPDTEGVYTYSDGLTTDDGDYYPFFAKIDGNVTYVWGYLNSNGNNYLAIHKVIGKYDLNSITEDIINNQSIAYVDFKAQGGTVNGAPSNYNRTGFYWCVDSEKEGYANTFEFDIDTTKKTVSIQTNQEVRRWGISVRCVYN